MPPIHAHRNRRLRRLTKQQRITRIYQRICKATQENKPLTIKQIANRERLSVKTILGHIRVINERMRKRTRGRASIQNVGGRYYYVETPEPERPRDFLPQRGDVVVRAYLDYGVSATNEIHIECIVVTPHDPRLPFFRDPVVIATVHRTRDYVAGKFGNRIAGILNFGFYKPTPLTRNQFHYRHRGGWVDF